MIKISESILSINSSHQHFGVWPHDAVISPNNFTYKSLSNWAFNIAVGCEHGCEFCYVPSTSTIKQAERLAPLGVKDPDSEWGNYVFLRQWDEAKFLASLRMAERTPRTDLKPDGNRAVIYCSTTDPYQVLRSSKSANSGNLQARARQLVRCSLELIRDRSTLNVRILTRSPLAREDFDLFHSFGIFRAYLGLRPSFRLFDLPGFRIPLRLFGRGEPDVRNQEGFRRDGPFWFARRDNLFHAEI